MNGPGFTVQGVKELKNALNKIEKLPYGLLRKETRKAANIVLKRTKQLSPEEEGTLKKSLFIRQERSRNKAKKVFQITFNRQYNFELVKISKDGKRYYYPSSQEFGYRTRNGGYIPGFRYMRRAAWQTADQFERTVVDNMAKAIIQRWKDREMKRQEKL